MISTAPQDNPTNRWPRWTVDALLWGCLLFLTSVVAMAQTPAAPSRDSLDSDECKVARRELSAAQGTRSPEGTRSAVGTETAGNSREAIERARDRVAEICFGRAADSAGPGRPAQAPIAVSPTPAEPSRVSGLPKVTEPSMAPPPVQQPRPVAITSCDAGGCWDSNGTRLSGTGPVLQGPKGVCTVQAGFVNCN